MLRSQLQPCPAVLRMGSYVPDVPIDWVKQLRAVHVLALDEYGTAEGRLARVRQRHEGAAAAHRVLLREAVRAGHQPPSAPDAALAAAEQEVAEIDLAVAAVSLARVAEEALVRLGQHKRVLLDYYNEQLAGPRRTAVMREPFMRELTLVLEHVKAPDNELKPVRRFAASASSLMPAGVSPPSVDSHIAAALAAVSYPQMPMVTVAPQTSGARPDVPVTISRNPSEWPIDVKRKANIDDAVRRADLDFA